MRELEHLTYSLSRHKYLHNWARYKNTVILAGMPDSSHTDVKLRFYDDTKSSTDALPKLPSMALDSGIPAGMTALRFV
jgi:hypothetical protein